MYKNKLHILPISILVILAVVTYLNSLPNQFVYDDVSTIVENSLIKEWENFPTLFSHDYFKCSGELTYRPVITISYFIDYSLWRMNPVGYHAVNVFFHTINTILIYFLISLLFRKYEGNMLARGGLNDVDPTRIISIALLTSIMFAIHPIVNEVVNGISYREDLIATAFLVSSFLFFMLYKRQLLVLQGQSKQVSSRKSVFSLYSGALACYFFGLFSKESTIVLPALIFCYEIIVGKNIGAWFPDNHEIQGRRTFFIIYKKAVNIVTSSIFLGYIGVSVLYLLVRFVILQNPNENLAFPEGSFFVIMLTMVKVLGRYIANVFMPFSLNPDYHVLYLKTPFTFSFIIPFLTLTSIVVIAVRLVKKFATGKSFYRIMVFAIVWFFISMLPVINIIPLANIMADRYLYLPILGFCLFISNGLIRLGSITRYILCISLIIFCIFITVPRNNIWRDNLILWYESSLSPLCSFTTYNNLGAQLSERGDTDAALLMYSKAIQKSREVGFTKYAAVYYNMGNAYQKKDMLEDAVKAYKKAVQIRPEYKEVHNNLGKVYFTLERYNDALNEYETAIKIDLEFSYAYNNLGVLYNKLGRGDDAIAVYKKAISLDNKYGEAYYNLGNVYEGKRQYDLAMETYQIALKVDPTQIYAHNNLGTIYDKKGLIEDAIMEYHYAINADPKYPFSHNNLGAALIKKGDIEGALVEFKKAVDLLPSQPDFHFNLGYTYQQKDQLGLALKEFEIALKIAPSHIEALFNIGVIYYKQGFNDKARKIFEAVLGINPKHLNAKKYLKMLSG